MSLSVCRWTIGLLLILASLATAQGPRPNILVIVSDDHRADVLGCAGHPIIRTPSIDRLAAEGTRFSNAFVTTSICAASRATILTGLVERTHRYTFGTPPLSESMVDRSYPALLKAAGYRTGFVGKFGVRIAGGEATRERMFDWFVQLSRTPYVKTLPDGTTRHVTDITGDRAIEFLRTVPADVPFCLSVSFNAGHAEDGDLENQYPYPETEEGLYADARMPRPRLDGGAYFERQPPFLRESMNRDRYVWRWDTPEKYDRNMRHYLRLLTGMDRNVGRIMEELRRLGLDERTVVIFIGDNGYYMGERGFAGKWSHYDESLRVPLVIRDPRVGEGGRVADPIALNLDVAPTVLDLGGVEAAETQGRSLVVLLSGAPPEDWRTGFFCEHLMRHARIPRWEGFRTGRFKYAHYLDEAGPAEFLYDFEADPDELVNLAASPDHRERLRSMRDITRREADRYARAGDPLPRVLLLGDSISMGYHRFAEAELIGEAVVVRPAENCEGTTKGVAKIDEWLRLDGGGFDVIHVNFGLHDLKHVHPDGTNSNDPADARQAEPEVYVRQLRAIIEQLEETGAEVVFATTTPYPGGVRPFRAPEDAALYNEIARAIMAEHGVAIDDLHAVVDGRLEELQRPANVHFTEAGSRVLGEAVAEAVREALVRRKESGGP